MPRALHTIALLAALLSLFLVVNGGCQSGQYCGWCGCDAMYGPGYTCRYTGDYSCCWGAQTYDTTSPVCGNNRTECEPCDDGNLVNGDGCSSTCTVEPGYSCVVDVDTQRSVCTPICSAGCGNGTCVSPNVCTCQSGFAGATCNITLTRGATTCSAGYYCGWCGCDAMYGPGYTCRVSSDHTCCWGNNNYDHIDPAPYCGNNRTECEPCDDGNTVNGDGCSSTCTVEPGYSCVIDTPTQRSICTPVCSPACKNNGTCVAPGKCQCPAGFIGNSCEITLVRGASTCSAGYYCGWCGCDAMYGPGYTCRVSSDHTCCWGNNYYDHIDPAPLCGNNRTECEPCDDGNVANGDGCSSTCTVETGYSCVIDTPTQRSICTTTNECLSPSLNNCNKNATCTDLPNGYSCACNNMTYGDGVTCVPNECVTGSNNCAFYQTCVKNSTSGYYCVRKNAWYAIDNGSSGGAGCSTTSTSDTNWCLQPFDGTRSQYVEFYRYQIPTNGYTVEMKFLANIATVGQGWVRMFEFGNGPDNDNIIFTLPGFSTGAMYRPYFGSSYQSSLTAQYTYGTVGRFSLSHSTDGSLYLATNSSSYVNDVISYPNPVTRTMRYTGRSLYTADSYLFGKVGEIRLWNVARTFAQCKLNTEVHLDPYTAYTGLIGLYQFDKVCGTSLIDLSGNSNHALLQNFATSDLFPSCYGRGVCNTATTTCTCNSGYGGYACDKAQ